VPANLKELCEAVKFHKADLGIATDPDVDRCVLIDETGAPVGKYNSIRYILCKDVLCKNMVITHQLVRRRVYSCFCSTILIGHGR
jgi:phosphomannomutase